MSLSFLNPSSSLFWPKQAGNAAKILAAGKLAQTAVTVFDQKNTNMPGYRSSAGKISYKRKRRGGKKKTKLATVASVKRMIMGREEKKFRSGTATMAGLNDAQPYTFNLTARIGTGTEDGDRVGDSINLTNLEGFLRWVSAPQGAFYTLRVLVFWSGEEYDISSTLFSSAGFGGTQLFKPYSVLPGAAITNPKAITVLHDSYHTLNSLVPGYEDGVGHRFNIPFNGQKFNYRQDLSKYGKTKNLYCVLIGNFYTTNATAPTTAGIAYLNYSLNYTDS